MEPLGGLAQGTLDLRKCPASVGEWWRPVVGFLLQPDIRQGVDLQPGS